MGDTRQKASGSVGSKGWHFQINLLSVVLLNALRQNIRGWKLSTENIEAGKFDDVVLESDDGAILLQAKHKETKKITLDNLLSTNSKNDDFSLPKYFLSYLDVRFKFPVKLMIICTNTPADPEVLQFLTEHNINEENILHYRDGASFFTFNEGIVPKLITQTKLYYENNPKWERVNFTLITQDNAQQFLKYLQIHINYSSGSDLDKAIKNLLSSSTSLNNLLGGISANDFYKKMENWFEEKPKRECLTEYRANAMFCEIKSENHQELLKNYNISFISYNFKIMESKKRIIHVVTEGEYLIDLMYVYHNLQHCPTSKILYVGDDNSSDIQKQIIKAFELPQYSHLIIAPDVLDESLINEMCVTLQRILENRKYKKLIILAERDNLLAQRIKSTNIDYEVSDESLTLENLSEDTQVMLLNKKNIILQGQEVSLKELLPEQIPDEFKKSIKSEMLEKLVTGEKFTVGKRITNLEMEMAESCYLDRMFKERVKKLPMNLETTIGIKQNRFIITEEDIYKMDDKIILISDSAGMGKSTVLKKIAVKIKRNNPLVCVFIIELNQCTQILRDYKSQSRSINIWELLKCTNCIELTNKFEKLLLSLMEIVVMLDGIDEISPDYTELILNLLDQTQKEDHLKKIFLTTRPHITEPFEKNLDVTLFELVPLTEENQIDFFVKYWMERLELGCETIDRCEKFAETLISKMQSRLEEWDSDVKFVASPLHAKMLAEVFLEKTNAGGWNGIKEYLNAVEEEPKFPENMNVTKLYQIFIEKKRDIFLNRGNPYGNPIANQPLKKQFDKCLDYHRFLALKTILRRNECKWFYSFEHISDDDDEKTALEMGIIQKSNNQLVLVHRTFAEYFVAESILRELQLENRNVQFQILLIDKILSENEFQIIRRYLNYFLENRIQSLSTNMFKSYLLHENHTDNVNLIHTLAKQGNTQIIRYLLKLVDFNNIKNGNCICNFSKRFFFKRRRNALTYLKDVMNRDRITIDNFAAISLQQAIKGRHLDTVKFLVEMGADVNFKTEQHWINSGNNDSLEILHIGQSYTALHHAVEVYSQDIILFLLESGADINGGDNEGITPLHLAAPRGNLDAVQFLLEHDADINITDKAGNTALHFATRNDRFKILELLVQLGADISIPNNVGYTPLNLAIIKRENNILAISLKYLHYSVTIHKIIANLNIVKFLMEQNCNSDFTDRKFNMVSHISAQEASSDIALLIKFLIEY